MSSEDPPKEEEEVKGFVVMKRIRYPDGHVDYLGQIDIEQLFQLERIASALENVAFFLSKSKEHSLAPEVPPKRPPRVHLRDGRWEGRGSE